MIEIKSPSSIDVKLLSSHKRVFLAGSIEQGTAEPWQERVVEALQHRDVVLFNPRRDGWDASLKQSINEPVFKEQVEWELNAIDRADIVVMYFDPNTKSPITLLEFGYLWTSGKLIIGCPQGFWRRGNLEVMCNLRGIRLHSTLDELIETVENWVTPLQSAQ